MLAHLVSLQPWKKRQRILGLVKGCLKGQSGLAKWLWSNGTCCQDWQWAGHLETYTAKENQCPPLPHVSIHILTQTHMHNFLKTMVGSAWGRHPILTSDSHSHKHIQTCTPTVQLGVCACVGGGGGGLRFHLRNRCEDYLPVKTSIHNFRRPGTTVPLLQQNYVLALSFYYVEGGKLQEVWKIKTPGSQMIANKINSMWCKIPNWSKTSEKTIKIRYAHAIFMMSCLQKVKETCK